MSAHSFQPSTSKKRIAVISGLALFGLTLATFPMLSSLTANAMPGDYPGSTTMSDSSTQVFSNQTLSSTTVGRDLVLNSSQVNGSLTVGRGLIANGSSIHGASTIGRDAFLNHCPRLGSLSVGRGLTLTQSHVEGSINVGRALQMDNSTITGDATVGRGLQLSHAEIMGTLHISSSQLNLKHARIGALDVQYPDQNGSHHHSSSLSIHGSTIQGGSGVMIQGSRVTVTGSDNHTNIHVGPDSVTSLNGMTVRGGAGQTTVITREGTVYVNGKKVSGNGPESYAGYRAAHSNAPIIHGPGWTEGKMDSKSKTVSTQPEETILQTVTLGDGTVIQGDITFESGKGKVEVMPGAEFSGNVIGGKVVTQS